MQAKRRKTVIIAVVLIALAAAVFLYALLAGMKKLPGGEDASGSDAAKQVAVEDDSSSGDGASEGAPLSAVFCASDYQADRHFPAPSETLAALLASAAADGKKIDAAILCGDYSNDKTLQNYQVSPESAIEEIRGVLAAGAPGIAGRQTDGREDREIFVQGNHDALTDSISESGLHEYDDYLVYVLNTQNDFPWKQGKTSGAYDKVERSAGELRRCMADLAAKGEKRPVIIAGHVPLDFTARTSSRHTTGDNLYSSLMFDAVNEAAEKLNIIYIFGHNHSKGWSCYLGGSCVYKAPGETLLIPKLGDKDRDVNTDEFTEQKLNFTYMNAGYTGYYMNCAPSDYGAPEYTAADETLTGTVLEIYSDRVVITRYDKDGIHALGSDGAADPYKGGIDASLIDPKYYSHKTDSPATLEKTSSEMYN